MMWSWYVLPYVVNMIVLVQRINFTFYVLRPNPGYTYSLCYGKRHVRVMSQALLYHIVMVHTVCEDSVVLILKTRKHVRKL